MFRLDRGGPRTGCAHRRRRFSVPHLHAAQRQRGPLHLPRLARRCPGERGQVRRARATGALYRGGCGLQLHHSALPARHERGGAHSRLPRHLQLWKSGGCQGGGLWHSPRNVPGARQLFALPLPCCTLHLSGECERCGGCWPGDDILPPFQSSAAESPRHSDRSLRVAPHFTTCPALSPAAHSPIRAPKLPSTCSLTWSACIYIL
mmetsp:Transcript_28236/g.75993  ORF Transcript_28236/g.75993 Transcript_28236/m.75993 type:complete len:205 (-) Transcript_28236:18-632(-)